MWLDQDCVHWTRKMSSFHAGSRPSKHSAVATSQWVPGQAGFQRTTPMVVAAPHPGAAAPPAAAAVVLPPHLAGLAWVADAAPVDPMDDGPAARRASKRGRPPPLTLPSPVHARAPPTAPPRQVHALRSSAGGSGHARGTSSSDVLGFGSSSNLRRMTPTPQAAAAAASVGAPGHRRAPVSSLGAPAAAA